MEDSISKSTKSELYARELEIQRLIVAGTHRKEIFKAVGDKFGISPRTVETQYYHIVKELTSLAKDQPNELRIQLMARNDYIYKRAMSDDKYKVALDANMAQAKLGGLFTEKTEQAEAPKIIKLTHGRFDDLKVVSDESE